MPEISKNRCKSLTICLIVLLLVLVVISLMTGSVHIPSQEVINRLFTIIKDREINDTTSHILVNLRLPRILLAIFTGATLAMAGLASQALFRNPLSTPSVIGVSNGAALGAVGGILLANKIHYEPQMIASILSTLAGLFVTALVFLFGKRSVFFGHGLLLAGIAINSLCTALTTGALYLVGERLQSIIFWLMGGLWQANWKSVLIIMPVVIISLLILRLSAYQMNIAILGEKSAYDLGVNLPRLQYKLLLLVGVSTSIAVSLTGVIGFIGLIVPHLLRLIIGADHRKLVFSTAIGGAALLLFSDLLARTLNSPAEIPVGIFTALIGAPIFIWLLQNNNNRTIM